MVGALVIEAVRAVRAGTRSLLVLAAPVNSDGDFEILPGGRLQPGILRRTDIVGRFPPRRGLRLIGRGAHPAARRWGRAA